MAKLTFLRITELDYKRFGGKVEIYININGQNFGQLSMTNTSFDVQAGLYNITMYMKDTFSNTQTRGGNICFASVSVEVEENTNLLLRYCYPLTLCADNTSSNATISVERHTPSSERKAINDSISLNSAFINNGSNNQNTAVQSSQQSFSQNNALKSLVGGQKKGLSNKVYIGVGVAAVVLVVVFVIFSKGGVGSKDKVTLENMYNKYCRYSYSELASDGSYLSIDTNPNDVEDYVDLEAFDAIEDINKELGFPDSITRKMEKTTALDGRQEYEGDKYTVSWKFRPNNGLEVMYEKK